MGVWWGACEYCYVGVSLREGLSARGWEGLGLVGDLITWDARVVISYVNSRRKGRTYTGKLGLEMKNRVVIFCTFSQESKKMARYFWNPSMLCQL